MACVVLAELVTDAAAAVKAQHHEIRPTVLSISPA